MKTMRKGIRGALLLSVGLLSFVSVCGVSAQGGADAELPADAECVDGGKFTAWIISDIHFLADTLHDDGVRYERLLAEGDNKNTAMIVPLLDAFIWTARVGGPDCVIITGDLTFLGSRESHLALAARLRILSAAGIPVYVIPGNHDIENPQASSFFGDRAESVASVSAQEFADIYGPYGYDSAIERDAGSLSYIAEPSPGIRLLMVDSTCSDENEERGYSAMGGRLSDSTRAWITDCAREAKRDGARIVAAMHHSLIDHNALINRGYTIEDSGALVELFSEADIRFVLTGHTHIQDVARADTDNGSVYDITTNALSVFPHNFGRLVVAPGGAKAAVSYESVRVDVASWARETGSLDGTLLDFGCGSEAFFRARSESFMGTMLDSACVDPECRGELLEFLVLLNERLFSGTECLNEEFSSCRSACSADELCARIPPGFLAEYARSLLRDPSPEDNALSVPYLD